MNSSKCCKNLALFFSQTSFKNITNQSGVRSPKIYIRNSSLKEGITCILDCNKLDV
jgi:hypothetical protein